MTRPLAVLIYYTRDEWPLRASIDSHIRALRNWPDFDVIAVNVAFPFNIKALQKLPVSLVVYHTTAVALRWYPSGIDVLDPLALGFADHSAIKIAMPQDDYMYTDALCQWLNLARVDLVLTPMQGKARALAYQKLDPSIKLKTILTTYLEERDIKLAYSGRYPPMRQRTVFVSYRAWQARAWVGQAGQQKVNVGVAAAAACERLGKAYDISSNPKDTVTGPAWFDFLSQTRAVVGVEGGSSLHDPDGSIFKRVEAYMSECPKASYAEVVDTVLEGCDHHADFTALSPRHFEAILTRTAQILVEGDYSGVLRPHDHYIPIKADFSDMEDAVKKLDDAQALEAMVERAWKDIVEADTYRWNRFLTDLAQELGLTAIQSRPRTFRTNVRLTWFDFRDRFNFLLLRLELMWARSPTPIKKTLSVVFAPVRSMLTRPKGWL